VPVLILEVDAERRRLSLSLKRVENGHTPADEPITGTPNLDLSEDVFTDARSAPEAPPLDEDASFAAAGDAAETAVEREAVDVGDELDPAATDEAVPAEAPVSEER
jgi:small subunit ribosomal protein S1